MIDIMIKNSNKLNDMVKTIVKCNKRHCVELIVITAAFYTMRKRIERQERDLSSLKREIKELKMKGE